MSPAVAAAILVISLSTQAFAAPYICTACQTSNTHRIYQTQTSGLDNLSQRSENLEDLTQHTESELDTSRNRLAFDNTRPGNWTDVNRYRTPDGHGQVYEEQGQRVQGPSRIRFYRKNFTSSYSSGNLAGSETPDLAGFGSYDSQLANQQSTLNQASSQQSFGQTGNSDFHQTASRGDLYGSRYPVDSIGGSSSYGRGSSGYLREDGSIFDSQSTQQRELVTGEQRPGNWSRVNSYRTDGGNGRVHEEEGQYVTGPRQVRYFRKNYSSSSNSGGGIPTLDGQSGGLDLERVIQQIQREINSQGREIHQTDQNVVNGGHFHRTAEYHRGTGVPSDQTNQRYLSNSNNYGSQNSGSQSHHTYEFHHGQDFHQNHGRDSDEDFGHNHNYNHNHNHNHHHQNQYNTHGYSTGGYSDTTGYDNQETQQVLTERLRPLNPQSGSQTGQVSPLQRPPSITSRRPNIDRRFGEVHDDQRTQQTINQNYNRNNGIRSGELITQGFDLGQLPLDTDTIHSGHAVHTQSCQHSGQQRLYRRNLKHEDYFQQTEDLNQQAEDLTQQTENLTQQTEDLTQQTEDLTQQTQQSQDLTQQTEDLTQQTQDLTQQTEDLTQQIEDLHQETQQITQQSEDLTQQTQDLTQQTQDFNQQSQDLTQQTEDLTQQITQQSEDLTQQTQDLTQQTQDFTQQSQDLTQQTQDFTQQTQDITQQSQDLTQQVEDLTQQTEDLTQQTEDLTQQTQDLTQQTQDFTQQTQDLTQQTQDLTQQTEDLTQQTENLSQQTEDLTQQTQSGIQQEFQQDDWRHWRYQVPDTIQYEKLVTPEEQNSGDQQTENLAQGNEDLTQQTEDLTQQTEDLTQQTQDFEQSQDLFQQTEDLGQQTEDLTQQTEDLTQQTEDLTQQTQDFAPQSENLNQQTEDLTQHTEDLTQQTEDLTQQTEDLSQQSEDLTQQTEDLTQQTEDLTQQTEDLTQQTEDLTQQTEDLTQQTEDLTQQNEDLTQQTEDLTQQTEDLTQQNEDLTQQTEDLTQQTDDLTQQTEDLTQQNEDLTQQTEDLTQQTEDLTQQTEDLTQQNEDLTQQTEDLTQQTEDLTQQTEDLSQQTEDLTQQTEDRGQQTEDLTQQTEDLTQQTQDFTQQSQDLFQQTEDLTQQTEDLGQQTEDLTQQTQDFQQSQDLFQQTEDLSQQTQDLTQQTEDLGQQTEDLTQQTQDFTQQSQDLFQQTEDLNQQTEDLTQQTENLNQQTEDLYQQTGFIDDYTNQRTSTAQFLQGETLKNSQQMVQQSNKPAPKPKRIKPLNSGGPQQIIIEQENTPVILSGSQPIPQNTGESRIPPRSHRGDQSIEANSDSLESESDESESQERELPQVQQQTEDLENHHSPPVQTTTSQNQFRQVQGVKTKTRPRSTYRPQYTGPRSWGEPHRELPLDVTTSQGPAIRYTDVNRNSQYTETPNFAQRQGTGQIEPEVRQRWSDTAESQPIRSVQNPQNTDSADQAVPFGIGPRILEAYGGGDPNDGSQDPNRYNLVKPNPSVTLPPISGDKDSWEIFYPPLVRSTTTTESPTTTPVATTTTTTPTPTPTSPPVPPTNAAPGFWSKLGHSITNTYDKAKEKAKQFFG